MNTAFSSIGIIGVGYVGGAVNAYFRKKKLSPLLYDTGKRIGSLGEVNTAELIFLCLPTPFLEKKGYDDSALWETMAHIEGSKTIVIKSTVLPGTTRAIQNAYPQHSVLFNPEFLRAKTANKDFLHPERQIIGYTKKSKPLAKRVLSILPQAPKYFIMKSHEAEMVKYFSNAFLALRVTFANQMYDLCQALGISYEPVVEAAGFDSRIGHAHFRVLDEGYRGYQGPCLPKDVAALIALGLRNDVSLDLLKTMEKINNRLLDQKNPL